MIVDNGEKTKVLFKDGDRVLMVFDGLDLVYNVYAVITSEDIILDIDNERTEFVLSNAAWKIDL